MARLRPKNVGKKLASADRKAGSEAQKMPKLDSMMVHIDDPMLFHVTSRWEVARSSVVMRRMEVIQTLNDHVREAGNKRDPETGSIRTIYLRRKSHKAAAFAAEEVAAY